MYSPAYEKLVVPFVGGLDSKSDEKTVAPRKLTVLENGEFTKGGSVRKRRGYSEVPAQTVEGTNLDGTVKATFALEDTAVLVTDRHAYGLSDGSKGWLSLGSFSTINYRQEPIVQNSAEQVYGECAVAGGVRVAIWEDSRGGVRMAVHDVVTGAPYAEDFSLASSNANRPKVVAIGGVLLATYVDTSTDDIKYFRVLSWDVETSLQGSPANLVTDLNTATNVYDIVGVGSTAVLVYSSDNTVVTGVRGCLVNSGGTTSSFQQISSSNAISNIALIYDTEDSTVVAAFHYSASNIQVEKLSASDLTSVASDNTTDAGFSTTETVALCKKPGGYVMWADHNPGSTDDRYVLATNYSSTLSKGSQTTVRHSFIAANGFYDGSGYVVLGHDSRTKIQDGYYLFNHEAKMVGQMLIGEGVGMVDSKDHVPSVRPGLTSTEHYIPLGFKREVDVDGDNVAAYEHRGIVLHVFDSSIVPQGAEAGRTLYVTGAQLWAFAQGQPVEAGFAMFPDVGAGDISHNATASSNIAVGDIINYRMYYEWRLPNGERIRSLAITRSFTATEAKQIEIRVPTLAYTLKDSVISGVTDVAIVGYRTEVNKADIYYRFTDPDPTATGANGYYANDLTADRVIVVDDFADSDLAGKEIDYLSRGERRHYNAPSGSVVANVSNRLFVSGGPFEDNETAYSLLQTAGRPIEFHDFTDETLAGRGPVQGIHSINGVPVIFKERSIYVLQGNGPDNTGLGGTYVATRVTSDVGLKDPGVVVETPQGLIFKSHKGFYLLDQAFNVSYVGAYVERYNDQTFTAATVIPNSNTVVFLASSGFTLIYDYFYGEWGTWTNHEGMAAFVLAGDTYCYLRNDGALYKRNSEYTDAGVPYAMRLRTAPLRPEHLQGFWKIRLFQVLGDYQSLHKLKVSILYDRDTAPSETYTLDPSNFIATDVWGDGATWGASSYWGGSAGGNEYQHGHRPRRSKCQTIRLEFEDIPGINPGASYELTELAILYRDWGGLARLPNARKH